jgi:hypothetical protein
VPIDATRRQRPERRERLQLRDPDDDPVDPDAFRAPGVAAPAMNNKVMVIAHRAYGFRKPETYITTIYHCCAARCYREHLPERPPFFSAIPLRFNAHAASLAIFKHASGDHLAW